MADRGTTSPSGIFTENLTRTPLSTTQTTDYGALYNAPYTDMSLYDSNDRGLTADKLGGSQSIPGSVPSTVYYKMRGYYTIGSVYETYIVTGSPSLTVPSGHVLTNIIVASTWTV